MADQDQENLSRILASAFILKQVDLERFSEHVISENNDRYQLLIAKMLDLMNSRVRTSGYDYKKEQILRELSEDLNELLGKEYKQSVTLLRDTMRETADISYTASAQSINALYGINLVRPQASKQLINNLASRAMIQGLPQQDYWKKQTENLKLNFMSQIRIGLLQGETLQQIERRVRGVSTGKRVGYKTSAGKQRYIPEFKGGVLSVTTREASALIRTSINTVANNANSQLYSDNMDVVGGVRTLVTLDTRTSPICQSRAGLIWYYDKSGNLTGDVSYPGPPPYHFNCRTILIPVVRTLDELVEKPLSGDTRKKVENLIKNPQTQTSMSGKRYNINQGYEGWLRDQNKATQLEVLGPGRYKLWKAKKLTVRELVNQKGRALTLEQLRNKYDKG